MTKLFHLFAALTLLAPVMASAQWLPHPDSRVPRKADGTPDLEAPAPRTADGKPDLSGVWQNGQLTGAMAVDTLISMVERNERGLPSQATTLMLEGQWNEGRTLRPLAEVAKPA
jgi:hypothetical protein